jgi:hypothetical protein
MSSYHRPVANQHIKVSERRGLRRLWFGVWRARHERAVRVGAPPTSRDMTPVSAAASRAVSDLTASSGERCGGAARIPSPQVMPMPHGLNSDLERIKAILELEDWRSDTNAN